MLTKKGLARSTILSLIIVLAVFFIMLLITTGFANKTKELLLEGLKSLFRW